MFLLRDAAGGAATLEVELLVGDFAPDQLLERSPVNLGNLEDIPDLTAVGADEVGMGRQIGIVVRSPVVAVNLANDPFVFEDGEIPIHGAERDFRNLGPHLFEDPVRGGVGVRFLDGLVHNAALASFPGPCALSHTSPYAQGQLLSITGSSQSRV